MPVYLGVQGVGEFFLAPSEQNQQSALNATDLRRRQSANAILRNMGRKALYNGYLPVTAIHRTNVERIGEAGEVILDDHQISFNGAHIPFARKGGQFLLNKKIYTLKTALAKTREGLQVWVAK